MLKYFVNFITYSAKMAGKEEKIYLRSARLTSNPFQPLSICYLIRLIFSVSETLAVDLSDSLAALFIDDLIEQ